LNLQINEEEQANEVTFVLAGRASFHPPAQARQDALLPELNVLD
jgi:hypothetical protein